jgi:hypothetical protein
MLQVDGRCIAKYPYPSHFDGRLITYTLNNTILHRDSNKERNFSHLRN